MMRKMLFWLILTPLFWGCKVNHFLRVDPVTYTVEDTQAAEPDSTILAMVQPYKMQLSKEMDQVIGVVAFDLERGKPEAPLGNLVADALKIKAEEYTRKRVDFALANSGGLRIPVLPKGEITKSDIFELLPFDNVLVILELEGSALEKLINHMAASGGWPISKGLSYHIVQYSAKDILINGKSLEEKRIYRVAMPDYVANGGDDASFLQSAPQESTGRFMRDAVIEFIQSQTQPISAKIEGRVEIQN